MRRVLDRLDRGARRLAAVGLVFAVLAAGAMAFTHGGFDARKGDGAEGGYYQRLADAFLDGELAIKERPQPSHLNAPNPYSPTAFPREHRFYGTHDASLYEGRFYYYWLPAPVVTLVIPARAVGIELDDTDVGRLSVLALLAVCCAFALTVGRRLDLSAPATAALAVIAAAPFSAWFQLTRLAVYEANILYAAALAGAAALCFFRGGRRMLLLGGVLAGLAMASRLESGAVALVALGLVVHQSGDRAGKVRDLAAVAAPMAVVLGLLLAYNQARFDSPLDFGQTYVVGMMDHTEYRVTSVAYVLPSLYFYLVRAPGVSLSYPYFDDGPLPWHAPSGYLHFEPSFGAWWTMPALVPAVVVAAWLLLRRRGSTEKSPELAAGAWLFAAAATVLLFASYAIYHSSQRYRLLFDVFAGLGAVFVLGSAIAALQGTARRALTGAVALIAALSLGVSILGAARGLYPSEPSHGSNEVRRITDWLSDRL